MICDTNNPACGVVLLRCFHLYRFVIAVDYDDNDGDGYAVLIASVVQEEIMKIFALFDEDGTGGISFRNLKRVATELGENLNDDELQVK